MVHDTVYNTDDRVTRKSHIYPFLGGNPCSSMYCALISLMDQWKGLQPCNEDILNYEYFTYKKPHKTEMLCFFLCKRFFYCLLKVEHWGCLAPQMMMRRRRKMTVMMAMLTMIIMLISNIC